MSTEFDSDFEDFEASEDEENFSEGEENQEEEESEENSDDSEENEESSEEVEEPQRGLFHERSSIRSKLPLAELEDYLPGKKISRAQLNEEENAAAVVRSSKKRPSSSSVVPDVVFEEDDLPEIPTLPDVEEAAEAPLISSKGSSDSMKSRAFKRQKSLFDELLTTRISLQPVLQSANRFPDPKTFRAMKNSQAFAPEWEKQLKSIEKAIYSNLDNLNALQAALIKKTPHLTDEEKSIFSSKPIEKSSRSIGAYSQRLSKEFSHLEGYYQRIIDRWNVKTQVQSGNLAILQDSLKSINQRVWQQIENSLIDKQTLKKRSQLNRAIGNEQGELLRAKQGNGGGFGEFDETEGGALLDGRREVYDEAIYDDSDYYSQLLQEILSSAHNSQEIILPSSMKAGKGKILSKSGRLIDRRASKGRKMKYIVHPKLVQFCAPMESASLSGGGVSQGEFAVEELFRNLFGRKAA